MFSKKVHADVKKSTQKVQDLKKDSATRLKHLKIVLENVEADEAKIFFENNFSHIYYILYDSFVIAEANLRQRELSFHLVHKAHREELELVLSLLERLLRLLPELLARRWQYHSLRRLLAQLLHPANAPRLRRDAVRLFLLWYQALGDNACDTVHAMFATLVPGFPSPFSGMGLPALSTSSAVFHDALQGPVSAVDILPLLPPQTGEKQPDDSMKFFFDALLELMVSQVQRIEWRDRLTRQHKCFVFLFDRFRQFYLPHIFPEFSTTTSLYRPILDLPVLRSSNSSVNDPCGGRRRQDPFIVCRVAVIKWVALFTHVPKKGDAPLTQSLYNSEDADTPSTELRRVSVSHAGAHGAHEPVSPASDGSHCDGCLVHSPGEDPTAATLQLVRDVLYCSRDNVNFVHEVYRQAFLLNFTQSPAIRKAIAVYKDWIQMNVPELPPFMLEPLESLKESPYDRESRSGPPSGECVMADDEGPIRSARLRNDSYLGAIHRENLLVRAGLQNLLQVFITHAANVFLLEVSAEYPLLLEEQVDTCKRVLNIYRYMVMHTRMESRTWEQLLLVLLQITSLILSKTPPTRKEETLGGKLAPAIFQTLIVTWIKANLNVVISSDLWDQFLSVLSSLTQWEELIREWAKTLETLTRVLARHVYNLDLTDLPLDRLTEQKAKRRRAGGSGSTGGGSAGGGSASGGNQGGNGSGGSGSSVTVNPSTSVGSGAIGGGVAGPRAASRESPHPCPSPEGRPAALAAAARLAAPAAVEADGRHFISPVEVSSHGRSISGVAGSVAVIGTSLVRGRYEHGLGTLHRSASESHLAGRRRSHLQALPDQVEKNVLHILSTSDFSRSSVWSQSSCIRRKSHSVDSLLGAKGILQYSESEGPTRSPSPSPSSGVESNSIKDSPMQIDVISGDGTSLDLVDGSSERRSVMAGGSVRGWLPDVAVVLWRRMLGALGDVNNIENPVLHCQVFEYLVELCDTLTKIRLNQGVSADNQVTPLPPNLVPPIGIVAPWCFKALSLGETYHLGKIQALRLLCQITVVPQDIPPSKDYIAQFYHVLHNGLIDNDQAVQSVLVRHCGPRFFSLTPRGHSLLMLDFAFAARAVLQAPDSVTTAPRVEAASILGVLLCLPEPLINVPVLQSHPREFSTLPYPNMKECVLEALLHCRPLEMSSPTDSHCVARCVALCGLGLYVYQQLQLSSPQSHVHDAVHVLLTALRSSSETVGRVAADILLLFCDQASLMVDLYPDLPPLIIKAAAGALARPVGGSPLRLAALVFCLGEWCVRTPPHCLLTVAPPDRSCLLADVFDVLCHLQSDMTTVTGTGNSSVSGEKQDSGPSIVVDNQPELSDVPRQTSKPAALSVQLAARTVIMHLVNHLGHFPMTVGAARLSSLVVEHDDVPGLTADELSAEVFSAPNIQLLVAGERLLVSLVELPPLAGAPGGDTCTRAPATVRVLLRGLSGKACWDAHPLHCHPIPTVIASNTNSEDITAIDGSTKGPPGSAWCRDGAGDRSLLPWAHCPPQHTLRRRPPHRLPTWEDAADDLDNLDDLLQYIGHTSPECLQALDEPRNRPAPPPPPLRRDVEDDAIGAVLGQRAAEMEFLALASPAPAPIPAPATAPGADRIHGGVSVTSGSTFHPQSPTSSEDNVSAVGGMCESSCLGSFQHCRLLFSHLGLAGWEYRSRLHLLSKNEKLLRELRNLDSQRCRETHKVAVIYVAEGQEDKNSILSNICGSQAYEEFIAGLAWEVELESHNGFLGGLQRNKSSGETAPYFATSFTEVIFHVATRMPSSSQESLLQKTRHLGNDEVHIVWSEHVRDYRRGIIPTEFCDVLIVIYPLDNKLFRVQVNRKPEVPFFGPLFNEAIVDHRILPGLVRATAINASRAKRSMLPLYQNYYEERSKSLETVVRNHKESTTFEEFAAQVFSPVQCNNPFTSGPSNSSGRRRRSPEPGVTRCSTLAAALLDSQPRPPAAVSNDRLRGPDGIRVWFANNEPQSADGLHGISPRPLKKLSFKTTARKSLSVKPDSLTPPDSPTTRKFK